MKWNGKGLVCKNIVNFVLWIYNAIIFLNLILYTVINKLFEHYFYMKKVIIK
jgi:hypothetical protein